MKTIPIFGFVIGLLSVVLAICFINIGGADIRPAISLGLVGNLLIAFTVNDVLG